MMLHGDLDPKWSALLDAHPWRKTPYVLLLAALLLFGCFPRLLTDKIFPDAAKVVGLTPVSAASAHPIQVRSGESSAELTKN